MPIELVLVVILLVLLHIILVFVAVWVYALWQQVVLGRGRDWRGSLPTLGCVFGRAAGVDVRELPAARCQK